MTFKYTIETRDMELTLHEPSNDAMYQTADFTNTYTQQAPGTKTVKIPRTFTDMTESHWAYWYALEAANGHDYTRSGNSETRTRTYQ
ncbi:MAG: hypothetical protein PUE97_03050 [Subdoligranulum variabile]|nr:hypothetical protein [Subdoligranulum variabile]